MVSIFRSATETAHHSTSVINLEPCELVGLLPIYTHYMSSCCLQYNDSTGLKHPDLICNPAGHLFKGLGDT